jgi:hypothetical protein
MDQKKRPKDPVEMDPPILSFWVLSLKLKPSIKEFRSFTILAISVLGWLFKGFGGSRLNLQSNNQVLASPNVGWSHGSTCPVRDTSEPPLAIC